MERADRSTNLPLLASIAVAVLGGALLALYVRQFQHTAVGGTPVALLALRKNVPAGEPIRDEMLIAHTVPESYVESRQVLASEKPRILGVRTAIDLEANQTLAWTDLASTRRDRASLSTRIPPGLRAMSIEQSGRRAFGELLRSRTDFVTLLLSVDQASLLAHAKRDGELSLTLRNESDLEINENLPETDDFDVLVQERRARKQRRLLIERVD